MNDYDEIEPQLFEARKLALKTAASVLTEQGVYNARDVVRNAVVYEHYLTGVEHDHI